MPTRGGFSAKVDLQAGTKVRILDSAFPEERFAILLGSVPFAPKFGEKSCGAKPKKMPTIESWRKKQKKVVSVCFQIHCQIVSVHCQNKKMKVSYYHFQIVGGGRSVPCVSG